MRRKLRIAWSAFFGTLCLLLVALSVRSYSTADEIYCEGSALVSVTSRTGKFYLLTNFDLPFPQTRDELVRLRWKWHAGSFPASEVIHPWNLEWNDEEFRVMPILYAVVGIAVVATIPWLRRRFSLRTLLVATTLVAVGLGILALSN